MFQPTQLNQVKRKREDTEFYGDSEPNGPGLHHHQHHPFDHSTNTNTNGALTTGQLGVTQFPPLSVFSTATASASANIHPYVSTSASDSSNSHVHASPPLPNQSNTRPRSDSNEKDPKDKEKERKKQTQACDRCRMRKRKCDGGMPYCGNCIKGETEPHRTCTYSALSKKRGPKKGYKGELMERVASIEAKLAATTSDTVVSATSTTPPDSAGMTHRHLPQHQQQLLQPPALPLPPSSHTNTLINPLNPSTSSAMDYSLPLHFQHMHNSHQQNHHHNVQISRTDSSSKAMSTVLSPSQANMDLLVQEATRMGSGVTLGNSGGNSSSAGAGDGSLYLGHQHHHRGLALNSDPGMLLNNQTELVFDFGESLYSFQSIIGQSFMPSINWDTGDSLAQFLDDLQSPLGPFPQTSAGGRGVGGATEIFDFNSNGNTSGLFVSPPPATIPNTATCMPVSFGATQLDSFNASPAGTAAVTSPVKLAPASSKATSASSTPTPAISPAIAVPSFVAPTTKTSTPTIGEPLIRTSSITTSTIPSATNAGAAPDPHYKLSTLEDNLLRVFFAVLSMKIFCFHEPYFLAHLYPTNRHPPHVIYAICAVTCLFSDHQCIVSFGTTRNACADYTAKCMKEIEGLRTAGELDYDSLEVVQSLMLLALVEYGFNQPLKAYRKLVNAIQMAIRLKIDQEDPNIAMNPLSIWLEKSSFYSPDKLLVRRKLWEFCLYFDTCIGLAGGLPLVIYEEAYIYLLSPPSNLDAEARVDAASPLKMTPQERSKLKKLKEILVKDRTKTERGMASFVELIRNPPTDTVYNTLNMPVKSRPEVQYDAYHVIMNQLSFIVRRVIRLNYTVRTGKHHQYHHHTSNYHHHATGPDAGAASMSTSSNATPPPPPFLNPGKSIVQNLMPPSQEVTHIHNGLVDFYHTLPPNYKPFKSLSQFLPILHNPLDGSHPRFAQEYDPLQVHFINIVSNLLSALVLLHLPRTDDTRASFRLDSGGFGGAGKRASSAEVVLAARSAMVFLVKGFLPKTAPSPMAMETKERDNSVASVISEATSDSAVAVKPDPYSATSGAGDVSTGDSPITFATAADETVHSIVGGSDSELAIMRSRMPLSTLVLTDRQQAENPLIEHNNASETGGANIGVFCDPVIGFNIFTVAVAAIAVCTGGSNEEFNRGVLVKLEGDIESVDLPVMDCITYIWPVCGSFSDRLKRILQVARKRLGKKESQ